MKKFREDFLVIAQLTDIHLRVDGTPFNNALNPVEKLTACVADLVKFEPAVDFVLVTGDLADSPDPRAYSRLRRLLDEIDRPYFIIPGNHDDRNMVREAFADLDHITDIGKFFHYTIEDYPLRLIGLDTLKPDSGDAEMCGARLQWLAMRLREQPNRPTLIFMHHQPVLTRFGYRSKHAFPGAREMAEIIGAHRQVVGVVCGHLHRPIHAAWAGTILSVAPSLTLQRTLTLDNKMAKAYNNEPVAYPVYTWELEAGLLCHMNFIGDFGPDYPLIASPPPADG